MKKMILRLFILLFSINLLADEIHQFECDEEILLIIDELTMTSSEILEAKEKYFNKLLIQQNQDCISQDTLTASISSSSVRKGGSIKGSEIKSQSSKTNTSSSGQTLSNPSINKPVLNTSINSSINSQIGVPDCLKKFKNDDQFGIQLKEAISKEKDPLIRQGFIERYAKYNNIKMESIKC